MAINRDRILKDAEKLVQKGKIQQAIREYEKLLKDNPSDPNTVNRVGDLYNRVGQVDRAVELYEQIADAFTADGFTNKAIAIYKKINRLAPQRVDVFEKLAELYIQQGLVFEAKSQYQMLAEWYLKHDDTDAAVTAHQRLISIDPENHMAHLRLADLLLQRGEVDEALDAYNRLGSLLLERDKLDEAERLYRHALEQDPPRGDFLAPLCAHLVKSGRMESARFFIQEGRKRSPESQELGAVEVEVLLATGSTSGAVELAQRLLAQDPGNTTVAQIAGKALLGAGDKEQATELLAPAVEGLIRQGELGQAQKLCQELVKAKPGDAQVLRLAVRAFEPSGDRDMVNTLKASLADALYRAGDTARAHAAYLELLREEPDNKLFRERLAHLDGAAGAPSPAEADAPDPEMAPTAPDTAEDVVPIAFETPEATPPQQAPGASVGLDPDERLAEARVFAKYGLVDKALNHLTDIVQKTPDHVEARRVLVDLALESGMPDVALRESGPLLEHYRSSGDDQALEKLESALPDFSADAPQFDEADVAARAAEPAPGFSFDDESELVIDADSFDVGPGVEDDEVLIVELEEDVEPVADVAGGFEPDAADDQAAEFPDFDPAPEPSPEPAEPPAARPVVTDTAIRSASEMVDSIFGDDHEHPRATAEPAPSREDLGDLGPATPILDAQSVLPERPDEESGHPGAEVSEFAAESTEELVEISDSVTGPPESDLAQIDFFLEQSLYEDALKALRELESRYPDDPELGIRRMALKSKGVLLEELAPTAADPEDLFGDEDHYIDLAQELEQELAEEEAMVEEATGRGQDEAELEEVFREFQKGVAEQLSEEDSDTHFNLGIAYKEMGLLPEAIREFQVASRDAVFFVECCSMIGVCYVEQGLWDQAASWYSKALDAPELSQASVLALTYDLANAVEGGGNVERALELFNQIHRIDPSFRDTTHRINLLTSQRQAN